MVESEEPFPKRLQGKGVIHATGKDDSPPELITLRNVLRAWHWKGYSAIFDIASVICLTDRQWALIHKQIMDVGAGQERELEILLARLLPRPKVEEKANE